MSTNQLISVVATVLALCAGQILFKQAAAEIQFTAFGLVRSLLNPRLIIALFVYAAATFMWLYVLKSVPLRIAYPFTALAFFIVPLAAHFILGEKIAINTFVGAVLIAAGVYVSVIR